MATKQVKAPFGDCGVVPDFSQLPERCIATIVSFTTPRDACRLSLVSSTFKSACDSDTVWSTFLPSDYVSVLASASCCGSSSPPPRRFSSLKDLYFSLCDDPVLFCDRKMSFSLDRRSGKKCIMLSARTLSILKGDNPKCWSWTPSSDSRFAEVAKLLWVRRLEFRGKISPGFLSPGTHYAAYFVFKTSPDALHFQVHPVEVGAGFVGDEGDNQDSCCVFLAGPRGLPAWLASFEDLCDDLDLCRERRLRCQREDEDRELPIERRDGWLEVELGEFFVEEGEDREVEMRVLEMMPHLWKSDLTVEGIEIRPREEGK